MTKPGKKTDSRLIGAALLGAVALVITAVMIFGSGKVIDDRPRAVIYFDGSVNGLSAGAPVTLRGVKVGEVLDVRLRADFGAHQVTIPVYVAFNRGSAQVVGANGRPTAVSLAGAIDSGLRAQLQMQSVITGQLYVELSFMPEVPARLVGQDKSVPEIPAAPRILDTLKNELSGIPLQEIGRSTVRVLNLMDGLLGAPEVRKVLAEGAGSSSELHRLLGELRVQVKPVSGGVVEASASAVHALGEAQDVARVLRDQVGQTLEQIRQTLKTYETQGATVGREIQATLRTVEQTLRQADMAAAGLAGMVGEGGPARADIDQILRNLVAATRALRGLSETLERNPNALITGKR